MKFKSRLPMFLLTGIVLLLSFFASSCVYNSTSQTDEGYLYNHVYLAKDYFGRHV